MKNFLLLVALIACVYCYLHPQVEPAPPVVEPTPASTPAPRLHLYYHSPLDAPSMAAGAWTGSGYHSTDPSSRFGKGLRLDDIPGRIQ